MDEKIYLAIKKIADKHALKLNNKIDERIKEMEKDDKSHYLVYRALGIPISEGDRIDLYQNKGRFLYNRAGSFLEEVAIYCIKSAHPKAKKIYVDNSSTTRPKRFEIDCLVDKLAIEIKWRDATTDGDHVTKEHARVKCIKKAGYTPIRVMFYYPQREEAKQIQELMKDLYSGIGGSGPCSDLHYLDHCSSDCGRLCDQAETVRKLTRCFRSHDSDCRHRLWKDFRNSRYRVCNPRSRDHRIHV